MDSNRRSRLFDRKRPVPASFGSLSAPIGAAEVNRRTTGYARAAFEAQYIWQDPRLRLTLMRRSILA
jgi:hypothetical protein